MDSKFKSLINNTVIFGIGNIVTKLSQYIIIAICTYRLTTAEFGIAEVLIQTVAMLVPVFSADIAEGLFRFTMDKDYTKEQVFSNAMLINLAATIITLLALPVELLCIKDFEFSVLLTLLTLAEIYQISIKEFIRGIGLTKLYMFSGFVNAVVQIISCLCFVYAFNLGIVGYILTLVTSNLIEVLFCIYKVNLLQFLEKTSIAKYVLKDMLSYSIPLAPNKIMWWVISALNRYFVLWLVGASATGLYSVAAKFPALITVVVGFFFQAWQISALETCENKDKDVFFSKIFNLLWASIGLLTAASLAGIRFLVKILVSDAFFTSWEYAPFLLVAAAFSAIQSFLGVNYTIQKDSIGVLRSTTIAAVSNVFLNYVLIKSLGIQGATIATFISYVIVAIYRYLDTKKYVTITVDNLNSFIITFGILIAESVLLAFRPDLYMVTVPGFLVVLFVNKAVYKKGLLYAINRYCYRLKM